MNFDTANSETFEIEGNKFVFNLDRVEYLANDQQEAYAKRIKKLGKSLNKNKKKEQVSGDIISLYQEWNVKDNDEILYLLFADDDEDVFTDVTTENDLYANPIEELE
jgi:bisphosphoglycerate-independent phosphoglycerate mutase (AlkP superfamily)